MNVNYNDDTQSSVPLETLDIKVAASSGDAELAFGPNDVLSGRTRLSFNHIGNRRFREVVAQSIDDYNTAQSRSEKCGIVETIMSHIANSGGRFLKFRENTGQWEEVEAETVRQKIAHAIRDATKKKENKEKRESLRDKEAARVTKEISDQVMTSSLASYPQHQFDRQPAVAGVLTNHPVVTPAGAPSIAVSRGSGGHPTNTITAASTLSTASAGQGVAPITSFVQGLNKHIRESRGAGVDRKPSPSMISSRKSPSPASATMHTLTQQNPFPTASNQIPTSAMMPGQHFIRGKQYSGGGNVHGNSAITSQPSNIVHQMRQEIGSLRGHMLPPMEQHRRHHQEGASHYELRPDFDVITTGVSGMGIQHRLPSQQHFSTERQSLSEDSSASTDQHPSMRGEHHPLLLNALPHEEEHPISDHDNNTNSSGSEHAVAHDDEFISKINETLGGWQPDAGNNGS